MIFSFHKISLLLTLTSEVSRWQFFHACDTEAKMRLGWSNLPPCRFRKRVVNGSWNQNSVWKCKYMYNFISKLIIKKTRSIRRTQTPPRLWPLTCDRDLQTRSILLRLFNLTVLNWRRWCLSFLVNTCL